MITGIRSALFCDEVKNEGGLLTYVGLYANELTAESRPGFVHAWLALIVETDGKVSEGVIRVQAADYNQVFPFNTVPGARVGAVSFR